MKSSTEHSQFMNLPYEKSLYENSEIVLIPIINSSDDAKSKMVFPQNFFNASQRLEIYDEEQERELAIEKGIYTHPVINLSKKNSISELAEVYNKLSNDKKFIVSISNYLNSSFCLITEQLKVCSDISILHLDSKARLKPFEQQFSNDSVLAKIANMNKNIVQVGVRAISKQEVLIKQENKIKQFLSSEIKLGMYGTDWQEIVSQNLTEHVLLLLDLSVLDPSVVLVPNPEPGGLFWDEFLYLLKIVGQEKNVLGLAISGITDEADANSLYTAAKLLYKILNYII